MIGPKQLRWLDEQDALVDRARGVARRPFRGYPADARAARHRAYV